MNSEEWLLSLVIITALFDLVTTFWVTRRLRERATKTLAAEAPTDDIKSANGTVVECPECGAPNEVGYRYCRECVSELPVAIDFDRTSDKSVGRIVG
jgi:HAMP domain-containing protein